MATKAFQTNAFQVNAFQPGGVVRTLTALRATFIMTCLATIGRVKTNVRFLDRLEPVLQQLRRQSPALEE